MFFRFLFRNVKLISRRRHTAHWRNHQSSPEKSISSLSSLIPMLELALELSLFRHFWIYLDTFLDHFLYKHGEGTSP